MTQPRYALASDDVERDRLQAQAAAIAEPTAFLLRRGGLAAGMRVLDLGTGPGDVALQVAEIVGPEGSVVGVDQDSASLVVARERVDALGLSNVEFVEGDARTFVAEKPFDAVVCRLLLMHLPDAADVIAHHAKALTPGGVFVAVDYDMGGTRSRPDVPLLADMLRWLDAAFAHVQADVRVGMRLPVLMAQAGLRDVGSVGIQPYFGPDDRAAAALPVGVVRALLPAIVASGAATEDEVGVDTLEDRLADAVSAAGAVWTMPTVVGGWGIRGAST